MTTAQTISLGTLLRRYRRAAGLTQEELAAKAGVSARTISDLERGLTRRSHADTLALLADALRLTPDERAAFAAATRALRPEARNPDANHAAEPHYVLAPALVPLTPIVGREREEAAVVHLLSQDEVRLLTLTGPAGVGKTRLALQVATAMRSAFANGVCFVPLASVSEPRLVSSTLAQAFGLHAASSATLDHTLSVYLADKEVLLVLDNFEQVVAAAPEIAALLAACPRLKVLATSRATLHVRGEHELAVSPLSLPDGDDHSSLGTLGRYAAVALFVQRARAVRPTFALTEANAPAVVAICRHLDGLPLAIELAAPRIKLFSPQALLTRLSHRLEMLTSGPQDMPERHHSLQTAISWSYDMLDTPEQALFRRLAVFIGGWTLDAAEAVCHPAELGLALVQAMSSLLDKSLIQQQDDDDEEPRFGMLETIREYGLERLEEDGGLQSLRRRHAEYYLALAEAAGPQLTGPDQVAWFTRLATEHGNLRAVLQWTRENGEIGLGVLLAGSLFRYWVARAQSEGRGWLEELLALDAAAEHAAPGEARAQALSTASYLAYRQADLDRATSLARESVALCRKLGDARGLTFALGTLGNARRDAGDYEEARRLHEECLALQRQAGNAVGAAIMLNDLAITAVQGYGDFEGAVALYEEALALQRSVGNRNGMAAILLNLGTDCMELHAYDRAEKLLTESLILFRELEDKGGIAYALQSLGTLRRHQGDYARSSANYAEGLRLFQMVGAKAPIAEGLEELAALAIAEGDAERAVRLYAVAETLRAAIGFPLPPVERPRFERTIARLRGMLREEGFAAAWAAGTALSLEQVLATQAESVGSFQPGDLY